MVIKGFFTKIIYIYINKITNKIYIKIKININILKIYIYNFKINKKNLIYKKY